MSRLTMMLRSYRSRLVLGYVLVVGIFAAAWAWSLYGPFTQATVSQQERNLTATARAAALFAEANSADPQQAADRLAENSDFRVTIVANDGAVLADSDNVASAMENHANRSEIAAALQGEVGIDTRQSATENRQELYVAVPMTLDGEAAALRVSQPLAEVDRIIGLSRNVGLGLLGLSVVLALVVAGWRSRMASKPVSELSETATAMASGNLSVAVPEAPAELHRLSSALSTLRDQLRERITALEDQERTLRAALDGLPDAIFLLEGDVVRFANHSASRLFRPPAQGWQDVALHEAEMPESLIASIEAPLANRAPFVQEAATDPFGRTLRVLVAPLDALAHGRTLLAISDISERARLEGMRREFVANASHELKTPVTGIRLLAATAADAAADGDVEQALAFTRQIEAEAIRLNHLVVDLLDLSRLEATPSPDSVTDIRRAVGNAVTTHAPAASRKGLELSADLSAVRGIDVFAAADPTDVAVALDNLLDNAIAYTESGSVRVYVETTDAEVRLAVADTGPGISAEHLPRIFERFYRIDRARTRDGGGTGLGLALVRHVAERSGGSVEVHSEVGAGTTFTVRLPRAK
ncbi:MAG: ATP-binding protein [Coriobacteriia bacterium]